MRALGLFSGLGGWEAAFRDRGHEVVTSDWQARFGCTVTGDIMDPATRARIAELGPYDVVLASPPCEAFSVASLGHHWGGGDRAYVPMTAWAIQSMRIVDQTRRFIEELSPEVFIIENPRGMLRRLPMLAGLERRTVTYCQYGHRFMKPTDLWGGFPAPLELRRPCRNGSSCHEAAPRGTQLGVQGQANAAVRAVIPYQLSEAVCIASERHLAGDRAVPYRLF